MACSVEVIKTYYWLCKPGIIYGNLLTAAAGFVVAAGRHIDFGLLAAVLAGTALIIASACVVNNYLDREIDKVMERTNWRALALGTIPPRNAFILAVILGFSGFAILVLWVNWLTVWVGVVGYIDYVIFYGWSKRHSWHGTLVGSVSGSAPVVAGYTAVTGHLDAGALILFLILTFWQMPHFYAIAIRRLKDYRAAKIPVLPAVHGIRATKIQMMVYIFLFLLAVLSLAVFGYAGAVYAAIMGVLALSWLARAAQGFRSSDNNQWAKKVFLYSLVLLPAFLAAVLI